MSPDPVEVKLDHIRIKKASPSVADPACAREWQVVCLHCGSVSYSTDHPQSLSDMLARHVHAEDIAEKKERERIREEVRKREEVCKQFMSDPGNTLFGKPLSYIRELILKDEARKLEASKKQAVFVSRDNSIRFESIPLDSPPIISTFVFRPLSGAPIAPSSTVDTTTGVRNYIRRCVTAWGLAIYEEE